MKFAGERTEKSKNSESRVALRKLTRPSDPNASERAMASPTHKSISNLPQEPASRERPILFSAPMVRALLDGRKTQTRRIVKPQPPATLVVPEEGFVNCVNGYCVGRQRYMCGDPEDPDVGVDELWFPTHCPYGKPGDRLWVRETWTWVPWQKEGTIKVSYGADGAQREVLPYQNWNGRLCKLNEWRPSIFMPRWASRLTLEITDVRVQRVEEISEEDAKAEGLPGWSKDNLVPARDAFLALFYDINKRAMRGDNPWVWAVTFKSTT